MRYIGTRGRRYTVGGKSVVAREFVFRDAFKFCNYLARFAMGMGGGALGDARRYIEERIVGLGLKGMRAPPEVDLWNEGYWIEPPNQTPVVDLESKTGSRFRLSGHQKAVIRMMVLYAREYDIVIEVPWCWTIKSPREEWNGKKWVTRDPRAPGLVGDEAAAECSTWNEFYLRAIGRYLRQLRDEGDGQKKSRVDPGPIPILNEAANEYNTVGLGGWSRESVSQIMQRWHVHDTPSSENGDDYELLGISQGGPLRWDNRDKKFVPEPYVPKLGNGKWSPDDIRIHPPRDIELPWWEVGKHIAEAPYPDNLPIFVNETILLMPAAAYDSPGHKWRGLGTKDHEKYFQMVEDLTNRGYYVTIAPAGFPERMSREVIVPAGSTT
jgi:hypothetical protein